MQVKKIVALLLVVVLSLSMFAACSGNESTPETADSPAPASESKDTPKEETKEKPKEEGSGEPVVMDMFWFADGAETEAMEAIIADYQTENPEVSINILEIPYSEMQNKIMMSVAGGEPPALARTTESILGFIYETTVDIGEYVDDSAALLDEFMSSIHTYFVVGDKIIALPTDVTANGIIYNKTAFDKAGVAVPQTEDEIWTWDEFEEALTKVMADGDVQYGMVIDNPNHRWSTILYEFGGSFLTEDGPNIDSPESIEAIAYTKHLFDEGIVPASTWLGGEDPNNMFRSGQVATHLSGNWMLTNYRDNITDFEWGVTYLPTKKYRSSVPGGKQLAAFENSGQEQEAVDFILYATSQEPNAKYCQESLFISPRLDNASIEYSFGTEFFNIFANELENTLPAASYDWGTAGYSGAINVDQREGMYEVIAGTITPEEHAAHIAEISEEFLSENK